MNHVVSTPQKGFTLIELMLSMTFISVLLLAIAMTVIQIGNIYNKGITVKNLNQSSRTIAADITRSAGEAQILNLATDLRTNSAGGRLCFGSNSYLWNTTDAIENLDGNLNKFEDGTVVYFVKVPDSSKIYCMLDATNALLYSSIRGVDTEKAQELLPGGDHRLAINKFTIPTDTRVFDEGTNQNLYTLEYTIGSGKTSTMTADRNSCLAPPDPASDLTYCTVQSFTIVLKTGNRVK